MEVSGVSGDYQAQMAAMRSMARPSGPPPEEMSGSIVSEKDQDGDGALSSSELGFDEELFASLDSDGDGLLSASEFQSGLESGGSALATQLQISGFDPSQEAEGAEGMGGPPPGPPPSDEETAGNILSDNDSDGDGVLSAEELGVSDELFSTMDTDGDGVISSEELIASLSGNFEEIADAVGLGGVKSETESGEIDLSLASGTSSGDGEDEDPLSAEALAESTYDAFDTNEDGVVSSEELFAGLLQMRQGLEAYGQQSNFGSTYLGGNSGSGSESFWSGTGAEYSPLDYAVQHNPFRVARNAPRHSGP